MSLEILFCQGIEVWALQVSQNVDLAAQPSDGLSILCYIDAIYDVILPIATEYLYF